MRVTIRPRRPDDDDTLQEIRARAFAPVFASFRALLGPDIAAVALADADAEQAALLTRTIADPTATVLVAEIDGAPVGFATVLLDRGRLTGEVGLLAASPQGQGAGAALLDHALDVMRREGMRVAYVAAGADDSHAAALRAYEKAGFRTGVPSKHLYRTL